jgi:acyl-CoA thioesterase-1
VKAKYPGAQLVLTGMQMPPSMGQQYAKEFRDIYPYLANKNQIRLVPFILEGVGGELKLNQEDGIHPTEQGHKLLAENVWRELKALL